MSSMYADPGMPPPGMPPGMMPPGPPPPPPGPAGPMMLPPDPAAAGGLPVPPGGGGMPPPMDALNQGPLPAEGGMGALLAALGGGGPEAGGPEGAPPGEPEDDLDPIDLIKEAMKLLMMALAKDEDDERGLGITKGMGALQGILGGEQKKNAQLDALGA